MYRLIVAMYFFSFGLAGTCHAEIPPAERVPFGVARDSAIKKCGGKVGSSSLEEKRGRWIYIFETHEGGGGSCRVSIDAISGDVLNREIAGHSGNKSVRASKVDGDR